jgi:hypothetical protein
VTPDPVLRTLWAASDSLCSTEDLGSSDRDPFELSLWAAASESRVTLPALHKPSKYSRDRFPELDRLPRSVVEHLDLQPRPERFGDGVDAPPDGKPSDSGLEGLVDERGWDKRGRDQVVDLPGEETLQQADDFTFGLSFFGASSDVVDGGWCQRIRTMTARKRAALACRWPPRLRRFRP